MRFAVGSVARIYFDLVVGGIGQVGQTAFGAVQRRRDGQWFNAAAGAFGSTYIDNPLSEIDAAALPGRYFLDFDHAKDALVSGEFLAKLHSAGAAPSLVYRDLFFGRAPLIADAKLCAIQGVVARPDGRPCAGERVDATLIPVLIDSFGRGYQADRPLRTFTAADGSFELAVVRGATIRLEIRAIGYDRRAVVPNQPSVLLTAL